MRRIINGVLAAVLIAAPLAAQSDLTGVLRLRGEGSADARVDLFKDGALQPVGTADAGGVVTFDTSLLSGKPKINVRIEQCPAAATHITLFPGGTATPAQENECGADCKCRRRGGAFIWGNNATIGLGGGFSVNSPLGYTVIGAGAVATALVLNGDGSSTAGIGGNTGGGSTGGGTSGGGSTGGGTSGPSFGSVLGTFNLSATVQSRGNCGFNNFVARLNLSGTENATTGQLIESITRNYSGSSTANGANWNVSMTSSGSVPGLGNFTGTFNGQTNGSSMTATETLNFPCGSVVISETGPKQ
jgi:hypothetical protein